MIPDGRWTQKNEASGAVPQGSTGKFDVRCWSSFQQSAPHLLSGYCTYNNAATMLQEQCNNGQLWWVKLGLIWSLWSQRACIKWTAQRRCNKSWLQPLPCDQKKSATDPRDTAFWGHAWRVQILQSGFIAWPGQSSSSSPVDFQANKSDNNTMMVEHGRT